MPPKKHADKSKGKGHPAASPARITESPSEIKENAPPDEHVSPPVKSTDHEEPQAALPPSKAELLMKEIEMIEIPKPARVSAKDVTKLLPFYKALTRKPQVVVWTDLKYNAVLNLSEAKNGHDMRRLLAELFALVDCETNQKSQIVLDLYSQVIEKATELQLNFQQTSAFFSIVKNIHEKATETPVDNTKECLEYMDNLLCRHVVKRPPWAARIFDEQKAKLIRDYIIRTYFRYFEMYKYVFTPTIYMDLGVDYSRPTSLELPVTRPDLTLMNPVTKTEVTLEQVLREINMEDETAKAIAEGRIPQPAADPDNPAAKAATELALAEGDVKPISPDLATTNPRYAELDQEIALQVDRQMGFMRDRISEKFQEVDAMLLKTLGVKPDVDQFSASPDNAGIVTPGATKSGKGKAKQKKK